MEEIQPWKFVNKLLIPSFRFGFGKFLNLLIKAQIRFFLNLRVRIFVKNIKAEICEIPRTFVRINSRLGFGKEYFFIFWVKNLFTNQTE